MTMTVPLLSVSGSWLAAGSCAPPATVMPVTVNVTDVVARGMPLLDSLHVPAAPVLQVTVPVAPLLQVPVTVALFWTAWDALWTVKVRVVAQLADLMVFDASMSAM